MLRHVLDGVMGRILELKNEMVNLEYSEFHYFDDVLSDLKLTPVSILLCLIALLLIFMISWKFEVKHIFCIKYFVFCAV